MLHILGIIVKIIGILLLVLLGLIVAIILAVLFVPVGYRLQGERTEGEISGKASVYWLFHLIHVRIQYLDKKMNPEIYILGIPVLSVKRKLQERKNTARKEDASGREDAVKRRDASSGKDAAQRRDASNREDIAEKKVVSDKKPLSGNKPVTETQEKPAAEERIEIQEKLIIEKKPETANTAEADKIAESGKIIQKENKENFLIRMFYSIKSVILRILQIPQKIISRFRKMKLTIKRICDKIKRWKEFVTLDTTKRTLQFLLGRGMGILKHILPKRMKGNLVYGFDDPALTGQLLGVFAVFYPVYRNRLQVTPVFDHAVLEGKVELKGRIFTVYLAVQALRILLQKDVKTTYKRLQNKEA